MSRALLAGLGLLVVLGCRGDEGIGRRYPVSGRVTYKGRPVASGLISFIPQDGNGRVATGTIADGDYRLTTLSPNDGALPGTYQVTVVAKDVDLSAVNAAPNTLDRPKRIAAANKAAKDRVPTKYQLPQTSGLTREVEPKSNRFDFELVD